MTREPTDREDLAYLVNKHVGRPAGTDTVSHSIVCSLESRAAGRRLLVTYALRRYGNQPVTDALIEETLAQVNAAVIQPRR